MTEHHEADVAPDGWWNHHDQTPSMWDGAVGVAAALRAQLGFPDEAVDLPVPATFSDDAAAKLALRRENLGPVLDLGAADLRLEPAMELRGTTIRMLVQVIAPVSGTAGTWFDTFPVLYDLNTAHVVSVGDAAMPEIWLDAPVTVTRNDAITVLHTQGTTGADKVVERLVETREAMRRVGWAPAAETLVVVCSEDALAATPHVGAVGYCLQQNRMIVLGTEAEQNSQTVAHELTHLSGPPPAEAGPGAPGWLEEGASEFVSQLTLLGERQMTRGWGGRRLAQFQVEGWPLGDLRNYRVGRAVVEWLSGQYGLPAVRHLLFLSREVGFAEAIQEVLGVSSSELDVLVQAAAVVAQAERAAWLDRVRAADRAGVVLVGPAA